jgi:vacuolar protein sorting-associated protein 52
MLWPRFKTIFDLNLNSIRMANVKRLGSIDMSPHFVTKRYGDFTGAVTSIYRNLSVCALQ